VPACSASFGNRQNRFRGRPQLFLWSLQAIANVKETDVIVLQGRCPAGICRGYSFGAHGAKTTLIECMGVLGEFGHRLVELYYRL